MGSDPVPQGQEDQAGEAGGRQRRQGQEAGPEGCQAHCRRVDCQGQEGFRKRPAACQAGMFISFAALKN